MDPSKQRRLIALVLIVALIGSITAITVLNLPSRTEIEIDITLEFRSNSTSHAASHQYHWDAPGLETNVYPFHIDWKRDYGTMHSNATGELDEVLREWGYVEGFNIEWTELEPYSNGTWTLLLNFYVGLIDEGELLLKGDNQSMHIENLEMTDDSDPALRDGLTSLGIEALEVYTDVSFSISADVLQSAFQERSITPQISDDLEMTASDIRSCTISA
ncbi:hypothetical protein EU546_03390 [Candidatus Thorarchaeota archaeon]|nr:MAG: hypothetical protein EU546_03390 [Candidatus Thorarchaeota archaeon]